MTITHAAFDLTVQGLLPLSPLTLAPTPWTSDISPPALAPWTCGGHHCRPVQTCSFGNPLPTSVDIWWLKHVRFPSGRYASDWNVFLSIHKFKTYWENHMAGFKLKGRGKSLDAFITRNYQQKTQATILWILYMCCTLQNEICCNILMMKIKLNHNIPRVYFIQQHFPKVEFEQITLWPVGLYLHFPWSI